MNRALLLFCMLLAGCLSPFGNDGDTADDDDFADADDDDSTSEDDDDSTWDDDDSSSDDDDATSDDDDATSDDDDVANDDDATATPLAFIYAHTADTLYTVDPTTFAVSPVGVFTGANFLAPDITDLAVDPLGNMYAIGFNDVYTVNPLTAAMSHLGTYFDFGPNVNAATCLPDGTLIIGGGGSLYEASTTAATRTLIGTVPGDWIFAGDTVGLPDGLLYNLMAQTDPNNPTSLLTVDTDTLATNVLGATGTGAMFGLAFHAQNGLVYGFTEAGDIYTIDPLSGVATLASSTGIPFWGATTNPARWQ